MNKTTTLDVLVVYSASIATSATQDSSLPFRKETPQSEYNRTYKYLLQQCTKLGMTAGFSTSSDVIGSGKCSGFWTISENKWQKNKGIVQATYIFDKIAPNSDQRRKEHKLLFSEEKTLSYNKKPLHKIFFDKLETYRKLPEFCVPTVNILSSSKEDINKAIKELKDIIDTQKLKDFTSDLILKDRYGAAGNYVYKISDKPVKSIKAILEKNKDVDFILQPFLAFDKGFSYEGELVTADIRLIIQQDIMLQCYLRVAAKDDFRCNQHQGAGVTYINPTELPELLLKTAQTCIDKLDAPHSLYALDFSISNQGNPYLIEGIYGPGINWKLDKSVGEKMSKQLIKNIVSDIHSRMND